MNGFVKAHMSQLYALLSSPLPTLPTPRLHSRFIVLFFLSFLPPHFIPTENSCETEREREREEFGRPIGLIRDKTEPRFVIFSTRDFCMNANLALLMGFKLNSMCNF